MADITVTVEKIGYEDINMGTGTYARTTSTGGSQNVNKLNADLIPLNTANANWPASMTIEDILDMLWQAQRSVLRRAKFSWVDADTITIGPGAYFHAGTVEQVVYWDADLTFDSTDTGTQWYYLYIDDSAIVTAGTNVLTASELVASTTAPTWSDAKLGWYNGEDRCIFAYNVGSGSILEFHHEDNYVGYSIANNARKAGTAITEAETITIGVPEFCTLANLHFYGTFANTLRVGVASFEQTLWTGAGAATANVTTIIPLSDTQTIYVAMLTYSGSTLVIDAIGWFFPQGM